MTNVTRRFHTLAYIGFFVTGYTIFCAVIIGLNRKVFFRCMLVLSAIDFLAWTAYTVLIMMVRLSHTGKVCSGGYLDDDETAPYYYPYYEGQFFFNVMLTYWFFIILGPIAYLVARWLLKPK